MATMISCADERNQLQSPMLSWGKWERKLAKVGGRAAAMRGQAGGGWQPKCV